MSLKPPSEPKRNDRMNDFIPFKTINGQDAEYKLDGKICTVRLSMQGTEGVNRFHRLPSYPYGSQFYYLNPKQRKISRLTYKTPKKTKHKPKSKPKWTLSLPAGKIIKPQRISLPCIKYETE